MTSQNDLCSYKKDLDQGETSNIMFILKGQGLTDQEAADRVGDMLHDCYKRWYSAMVDLPFWGNKIDRDVLKYIEGCRNLALGNLTWRYVLLITLRQPLSWKPRVGCIECSLLLQPVYTAIHGR